MLKEHKTKQAVIWEPETSMDGLWYDAWLDVEPGGVRRVTLRTGDMRGAYDRFTAWGATARDAWRQADWQRRWWANVSRGGLQPIPSRPRHQLTGWRRKQ